MDPTPPTSAAAPLASAGCPMHAAAPASSALSGSSGSSLASVSHATPRSPGGCPVSAGAAAFDPFDAAYMQDPAAYLQWAREGEPVFYSPRLGYWVVTRYEDVKAVFRDNRLYSPSVALEKITPAGPEVLAVLQRYGFAMNRTLVNEDEPEHMARRRVLMEAFLPERLVRFEPMVRALARDTMDRFIDRGRADLVAEMFYEIPLNIALKFLGVPDDGAEQLRQFAVAHTLNTWGRPSPQEQLAIAENVGRFWQTAQGILDDMMARVAAEDGRPEARSNDLGEGWMVETIRQHLRHPEVVTLSYLRSMMMAILAAAHETTSNATANAFMTLLRQRGAWEALCDNPALIPNAVEECLRVAGSIIAWRRLTTADTVLGGVAIPQGSRLLIVQASANADPRHFENPDEVDIYRENAVEHLTFGYGAHQCMGKNIGRMQMRVFLEEFTRRLPHLRLVDGQRFEFLSNTSFRGPASLWVEWDPALNPERSSRVGPATPASFYIGPPPKDGIARRVVVRDVATEGDGLHRIVLADPAGADLPAWTAGAHVDLIAGGFRRKYSLCGRPAQRDRLQVVVQREADGRGGSRHFCDRLAVGDVLQLAGPKNLFRLDEQATHVELIAAGIGITPIIAMADRLKALGRSYRLHYAGRARKQMALLDRLQAEHADALQLYVKDEGRRLVLPQALAAVGSADRVYACGPARLIDELEHLARGWPPGVLHFEHFHAGVTTLDPNQEHAFVVELQDSGTTLTVPPDRTLLQALQSAGHDVPCDCNEGLCGTCEVQVAAGEIDHRDKVLTQAERAGQDRMMACCSRARGTRLVLRL